MSLNSYTVQPGSPRALVPRLRLKLELLSSVNGLVAQPRRKLEYGRVKMKGGGGVLGACRVRGVVVVVVVGCFQPLIRMSKAQAAGRREKRDSLHPMLFCPRWTNLFSRCVLVTIQGPGDGVGGNGPLGVFYPR